MSRESSEVKNFWQEYQAAVLRQGIPQAKSEWYGRWARRLARSVADLPLRARTAAHVRAFLTDLGQQAKVEPWQVDQAQEALRVLYEERQVSASTQIQALNALVFLYEIVQELLGPADVSTTMISTHVLNRPGLAVKSPVDA